MYDIYVYGEIGDGWGDDGMTPSKLRDELAKAEGGDVTIHINSGGGDVFDANTMAELIRAYKGKTVAVIEGLAASAASYFALTADSVSMSRNALFMIHNPFALCMGEAADMRKTADMLDKVRSTIANQYVSKTGRDKAEIEALMDDETYMDADTAHDMGFVDTLFDSEKVAARVSKETLAHYKRAPESLEPYAGEPGSTIPADDEPPAGAATVDVEATSRVVCVNGSFLKVGSEKP